MTAPIGRTSILGQMLTDEEYARVARDPEDRWRLVRVPGQQREALATAVREMYVDGTLEPTPTALLSEIVDRIVAALETP